MYVLGQLRTRVNRTLRIEPLPASGRLAYAGCKERYMKQFAVIVAAWQGCAGVGSDRRVWVLASEVEHCRTSLPISICFNDVPRFVKTSAHRGHERSQFNHAAPLVLTVSR